MVQESRQVRRARAFAEAWEKYGKSNRPGVYPRRIRRGLARAIAKKGV